MDETIDDGTLSVDPSRGATSVRVVVAWCQYDPSRAGEVLEIPSGAGVFGRGENEVGLARRRPGHREPRPPLCDPRISRTQLWLRRDGRRVRMRRLGRGPVTVDGEPLPADVETPVTIGSQISVRNVLLLVVAALGDLGRAEPEPLHAFGEPDEHGIVGESAPIWHLRRAVRIAAARDRHVLIQGESGVGKELVARALHTLSPRVDRTFVARNATTVPEGLIDAELFGNLKGYPNPGMPERPGLVGRADRGTLFLDEIGELPESLQAHLLRLLDEGEYQRLGESRVRRADLRVIAATNRGLDSLKHDVAARFSLRLEVPPLRDRPTDIPLILRHLLRTRAARDPEMRRALLDDQGEPQVRCSFVQSLLDRPLATNVREIETEAMSAFLEAGGTGPLHARTRPEAPPAMSREPDHITKDELEAALGQHKGSREATWRALGLRSRYQLRRLMKTHGLL